MVAEADQLAHHGAARARSATGLGRGGVEGHLHDLAGPRCFHRGEAGSEALSRKSPRKCRERGREHAAWTRCDALARPAPTSAATGRRALAEEAEVVALRIVIDEVDGGEAPPPVELRVVHAFALPQLAQHAAVDVVADRREVAHFRTPARAAAMAALDVSPPKPCRYIRPPPSPVWLNSTMGSPRARMSAALAPDPNPAVLGQALAQRLLGHDQLGLLEFAPSISWPSPAPLPPCPWAPPPRRRCRRR